MCRKCSGFTESTEVDKEVTIDGDVIEKKTANSCILSSQLWRKSTRDCYCKNKMWMDIANVLWKRVASLKLRGSMYKKRLMLWC